MQPASVVIAVAERLLYFLEVGAFFLVFDFLLSLVPVSESRKQLRVQHPVLTKDMFVELGWPLLLGPVVSPVLAALSFGLTLWPIQRYVGHQVFAESIVRLPAVVQVLVALLLIDLTTYVRHRFVHRFAWPYHTIHHAAREIHWTTTWRLHPGDGLIMGAISAVILHVVGFDAPTFGVALGIYGLWNWSNHLNLNADFGFPLRYVFVSTNMHRWHHAADDPAAQNKNFAVVFAFWDVLFGTYYVPEGRLPGAYGVWDETGKDVVSEGFFDQLLYPFRVNLATVRRWVGGDAAQR